MAEKDGKPAGSVPPLLLLVLVALLCVVAVASIALLPRGALTLAPVYSEF